MGLKGHEAEASSPGEMLNACVLVPIQYKQYLVRPMWCLHIKNLHLRSYANDWPSEILSARGQTREYWSVERSGLRH